MKRLLLLTLALLLFIAGCSLSNGEDSNKRVPIIIDNNDEIIKKHLF